MHTISQEPSPASYASDPFSLVKKELKIVAERLRRSILSDIPLLERAGSYFFDVGAQVAIVCPSTDPPPTPTQGKRLRPTILLLMASALSPSPTAAQFLEIDLRPPSEHPAEVRRQLQRIAEITELIHVASLLHDDVLDESDTRRGVPALNAVFGNKVQHISSTCTSQHMSTHMTGRHLGG